MHTKQFIRKVSVCTINHYQRTQKTTVHISEHMYAIIGVVNFTCVPRVRAEFSAPQSLGDACARDVTAYDARRAPVRTLLRHQYLNRSEVLCVCACMCSLYETITF